MSGGSLLGRKLRRDLRRQRSQVLAVVVTVMLGVALFVLSFGMSQNLSGSYDLTYDNTNFADVWLAGVPSGSATEVERLNGVVAAEERLSGEVTATFDERPIVTRLTGFGSDWSINTLIMLEGGWDPEGIVLEKHTADHFDLGVGDTISIDGIGPTPVVGVAASPEYLWVARNEQDRITDPDEFAVIFSDRQLAEPLIGGQTQVVVVTESDAASEAVAAAGVGLGSSEILTWENHPSYQTLQTDLDGFSKIAIMFPLLFLGAAALATLVLLSRLIVQQRGEVGMMRANGFADSVIKGHFARYGLMIAVVGALVGIPLGILGGWAATGAYTSFLGIPFTSRQLHPVNWLIGLVFALVTGAVAGLIPARAAIRTEPAVAMRPGGGAVGGGRSLIEGVLPSGIPSWLRVAIRNLGRQPKRVAATAMGIVLSLVLVMTAMVLNDSINDVFDSQYNQIDLRSLVVATDGSDSTFDQIAATPGVEVAEPHLEVGATLASPDGAIALRLAVFEPATRLHWFGDLPELPANGIYISETAADDLGVGVGDSVQIQSREGAVGTLPVAALVSEPFAGSSYLSTDQWVALGGPAVTSVGVKLTDKNDHRKVRDLVLDTDGVSQVVDRVAIANKIEGLLAASRFFVYTILALAVLMAVALIFNSMSITIAERETEVATLQANGVGRSWIRRAITAETLTTVVLSMVPGLILGRLTAGYFVESFSTDQFRFSPVLSPKSVLVAVAVLGLCAIAAQLPGLRRLDHLDLSVKVRERAL